MTVSRETVEALSDRHGLPRTAVERLLTQAGTHDLDPSAIERLAGLLAALAAEAKPPTTVSDPLEAVDVHIADSLSGLAAQPLREAGSVADIGAGAGFPGLAVAAALPDVRVDLIESTARKCDVIARLAGAAGVGNGRAIAARAEEWGAGEGAGAYDVVTARALAPLAVLAEYAAPLLRIEGMLVAWKGARDSDEERAGARAAEQLGLEPLSPLAVRPFRGSRERHLQRYVKVAPTPDRFPRRAGMAAKRPLAA